MQRFEAYEDIGDEWRWRLLAANGGIIASSGESFSSQAGALRAAEGVQANALEAAISIAPGLGIKAAMRFRALLAATDAGGEPATDSQRRARAKRGRKPGVKVRRVVQAPAPDLPLAKRLSATCPDRPSRRRR